LRAVVVACDGRHVWEGRHRAELRVLDEVGLDARRRIPDVRIHTDAAVRVGQERCPVRFISIALLSPLSIPALYHRHILLVANIQRVSRSRCTEEPVVLEPLLEDDSLEPPSACDITA